jgi:hypothetical protein
MPDIQPTPDLDALTELMNQALELNVIIETLRVLKRDNMFRYLSKQSRNELLNDLMETSGAVEDASKATVRAFKKIKRERVPDMVIDFLLGDYREAAIAFVPEITGTPVTPEHEAGAGVPPENEDANK